MNPHNLLFISVAKPLSLQSLRNKNGKSNDICSCLVYTVFLFKK